MNVFTTLSFHGRTEDAVQFYNRAIEAETLCIMRFRDRPDHSPIQPGLADKVFHATFRVGSTEFGASDCGCEQPPAETNFAGFALALEVDTSEQAERFFAALSEGGRLQAPLVKTVFAARHGMVIDRFGIAWKIKTGAKTQN